jgi:hypothetical protein
MRIADRWFETKPIDEDTWSVGWLTTPNGECDIGTGFDLVKILGCLAARRKNGRGNGKNEMTLH